MLASHEPESPAELQAVQINPQEESAWENLGIFYASAGEHALAIDAEHRALQINPEDANAWYVLGATYWMAGQREQALTVYQRLKTLDPVLAQRLFDYIVPK